MRIERWRARAGAAVLAVLFMVAAAAPAATVPDGFVDGIYVQVPTDATTMKFSPDGRLFIAQQSGNLLVAQDGNLLQTPFLTVPVNAEGERGLLGIAFDPDFATNGYIYVYYTATTPTIHNRVSRFTANGNLAMAGSEFALLDLDPPEDGANIHNGGAIHFGNDGKLYIAVGDHTRGGMAQRLINRFGKILRINRDGTIPADNPFLARTSGANRAIWAMGLRNPFTTAYQRSTGRLFINDVGAGSWEEINEGLSGANYGWPIYEGPEGAVDDPGFEDPFYAYAHDRQSGVCAITGGAFYEQDEFPIEYRGQYFFADYCAGWIKRLNPASRVVSDFATGIEFPVDLKVGADGALYYLARAGGYVGRIQHTTGQPPAIELQPVSQTRAIGQLVTFTVGATGSAPLSYHWRRNGAAIAGATAAEYTRSNLQLADNGALFDVVVSNDFGSAKSEAAQLTVIDDAIPTATITEPLKGTTYAAGTVISYAGTGSDLEDGTLPASAFTWWVDLHHNEGTPDAHTHPFVREETGSKIGSFTIPTRGETSPNVFYRLHLRVRDSAGITRGVWRDILPRKATVTLGTDPDGLQLLLDGQPVSAPHSFVGVVGIERDLEAVSPQGTNLVFSSWSDGGAQIHTISTPPSDTTYTARFVTPNAVSMSISDTAVYEGDVGTGTAAFPVRFSAPSTLPVTVAWRTREGTAQAVLDYTAASGTLTFAPGTTVRMIPITIRRDTALEDTEFFYVDLSAPSGATIADARGVGSIRNDDGPGTVAFSAVTYQKNEGGGNATITVTRTGGLAAGMAVLYSTSNGKATAGSDYTQTSGTLTFAAGVTARSFQVPITNDTRDETNETVQLTLTNPGGGAILGTRRTATLSILDNDTGGTLNFSLDAYQRSESGGTATITVLRSNGAAGGVTVGYSTTAGTASAGSDYQTSTGTLSFLPNQTSATFQVTLINDAIPEVEQTVNLALHDPTGGGALGARASAVLTILDDD